jgi:hypothetical protein
MDESRNWLRDAVEADLEKHFRDDPAYLEMSLTDDPETAVHPLPAGDMFRLLGLQNEGIKDALRRLADEVYRLRSELGREQ